MTISKPMLPPKKGYVEVEVNGKRTYRNVETGILIGDEGAACLEATTAEMAAAIMEGVNDV